MPARADHGAPTTGHRSRVLAVDWGSKRIGLALSDPTGAIAQPLPHVERRSDAQALAAVAETAQMHRVGRIVVGLPRNMDGSEGAAAATARRFGTRLAERAGLAVDFWDERLTTAAAERALVAADVSRTRRRRVRDGVAAALMLQGYLAARHRRETQSPKAEPPPCAGDR
jgi:putative Holliday junction resolvase